jgi:hypothetical protein
MRDTVLEIIRQVSGEVGIPRPSAAVSALDTSTQQLLTLLKSAGFELTIYYNWEQLTKEWQQTTTASVDSYALPADFSYFTDQTQWDRTNRWPLLGPKSGQEWQWLKGGLLASGPRIRYRLRGGKFLIHPVPTSALDLRAEYISSYWIETDPIGSEVYKGTITADSDIPVLDFWLLVKYLKYKFWAAKGFDTTSYRDDFLMVFDSLTGKDKGAPLLSLSPKQTPMLVGYHSVPDGSWNTGA